MIIFKPKFIKSLNDANKRLTFAIVRLTGKDKPQKGMFSRVPNYVKAKGRR